MGKYLGYTIYPVGNDSGPPGAKLWQTPNGLALVGSAEQAFAGLNRGFSLDSIVSVAAGYSAMRAADIEGFDRRLEGDGIPPPNFSWTLIRRFVHQAIVSRAPGTDLEGQLIDFEWFRRGLEMQTDLISEAEKRPAPDDRDSENAFLHRMLQWQVHDQLGLDTFRRELYLVEQTVDVARRDGLDLEPCYEAKWGLTYSELAALAFGAFASVTGKQGQFAIDPKTWGKFSNPFQIPPERIDAFFRASALTYEEYRVQAQSPKVLSLRHPGHALPPLAMWPLVVRSDGMAVAPIAIDLLERVTRSFLVEARQALQVAGRESDGGTLSRATGSVYQDYVRQMLGFAVGARMVVDVPMSKEKRCDFVIPGGRAVTLVEAKATRLRLLADLSKDRADLKHEFERPDGLADGLIQLDATARAVRQGAIDMVPRGASLVGLLVLRGEQVLLNSSYITGILDEIFREKTGREPSLRYQLCNDVDFEALVQLGGGGVEIGRWLLAKAAARGPSRDFRSELDFHSAMDSNDRVGPMPWRTSHNHALDGLLRRFGFDPDAPHTGAA